MTTTIVSPSLIPSDSIEPRGDRCDDLFGPDVGNHLAHDHSQSDAGDDASKLIARANKIGDTAEMFAPPDFEFTNALGSPSSTWIDPRGVTPDYYRDGNLPEFFIPGQTRPEVRPAFLAECAT